MKNIRFVMDARIVKMDMMKVIVVIQLLKLKRAHFDSDYQGKLTFRDLT